MWRLEVDSVIRGDLLPFRAPSRQDLGQRELGQHYLGQQEIGRQDLDQDSSRQDTDRQKLGKLSASRPIGGGSRQSIGRDDLGREKQSISCEDWSRRDGRQDPDGSHEDLLACLVCSGVQLSLRVEGRVGLDARLVNVLKGAFLEPLSGAPLPVRIGSWLLVGRGAPDTPLHGALVELDIQASTACSIRLYLR